MANDYDVMDGNDLPIKKASIEIAPGIHADKAVLVDSTGAPLSGVDNANRPAGAVTVSASTTGTTGTATITLPAPGAGKRLFIEKIWYNVGGVTTAIFLNHTVTGLEAGTLNFGCMVPTGVTGSGNSVAHNFSNAMPAAALNAPVVFNIAAAGAGCPGFTAGISGYSV